MTTTATTKTIAATKAAGAPRSALADPFSPAVWRTRVPTQWPTIGGPCPILTRPIGWSMQDIAQRLASGMRVRIAILACDGLHRLAKEIQMPLYKISVTADRREDIATRRSALNRCQYASYWREGREWIHEDGFQRWQVKFLPELPPDTTGSPVSLSPRTIVVNLPSCLRLQDFDNSLRRKLETASLRRFVGSPEGIGHCEFLGISAERFRRFTAYDFGEAELKPTPAEEIYVLKPQAHTSRLIAIAEKIIFAAIKADIARGAAEVVSATNKAGSAGSSILTTTGSARSKSARGAK